jgi:hypothetical protein
LSNPITLKKLVALWLCALTLVSSGCAQRHPFVVARLNPQHTVSKADKIAVTEPNTARSSSKELYRALMAELEAGGFQVAPPAEAHYKLIVLLDRHATTVTVPSQAGPRLETTQVVSPGTGFPGTRPSLLLGPPPAPYKEYRESEGIRLSLYPARASNPAQLQIAWDGYVDSGHARLSPKCHHALLKALLNHFGQDYTGQAELLE